MKSPAPIGKILGFWKKGGKKNEASQSHTTSTGPQRWDDDLSLALNSLLADKESKSYGTVQAITLSDFRDSIGPLWDDHQEKVLLIADSTIDRMLTKGQTAIREDEQTWLIVTPDLTLSAAETLAKTIAAAIGEKLVGTRFEETEDVDPTPQTGLIDLSDAMNEDGTIDRSAMKHAVLAAKAVIADRAGREKRRLAQKKRGSQKSKESTSINQTAATSTGREIIEEQLSLVFHPAWSADSQAIDTFVCRPASSIPGDPYLRDNALQVAANALAVMRHATAALNNLIENSVRAKLVVPIPLSSLLSPAQNKIINTLMKLEESHRFLYLRPEIVSVPHTAPPKDVLTARDLVRPIGRGVAVSTDIRDPNGAVMSAGKVMLGFEVGGEGQTMTDLAGALKRVHRSAGGRSTYVLGLPDRADVARAAEIGFDEIGGPGLAPPLQKYPNTTSPLSRGQLLASK